jgi:hypothetical protein
LSCNIQRIEKEYYPNSDDASMKDARIDEIIDQILPPDQILPVYDEKEMKEVRMYADICFPSR